MGINTLCSLAAAAGHGPLATFAPVRPRAAVYDAASQRRRLAGWNATDSGVNAILQEEGETLRARSRDMVRRNPWASRMVEEYVGDAIGTGIVPQWKHGTREQKRALKQLWTDWTEESDSHGLTDFYGQQALICREQGQAGECIIRMRPRYKSDGLAVPLQIQVLSPEHLPWQKNEDLANGNKIRAGIEFDRLGRRVAYHLYREHPGEAALWFGQGTTTRVPAEEVILSFHPTTPGQLRGEPKLAKILTRLYHLDQYEDAHLDKQKVAAMMVGVITEDSSSDPLPGDGSTTSGTDTAADDELFYEMAPGQVWKMKQGEKVDFSDPPSSGEYDPYVRGQLRGVGAGFGMPYTKIGNDVSQVNYSSGRLELISYRRLVQQYQHTIFNWQINRRIINFWLDQAVLSGAIDLPGYAADPRPFRRVEWRPQRWDWVDPKNDIEAELLQINNLLKPRSATVNEMGYDEEEVDEMIAADQERESKLGLQRRALSQPQAQQQGGNQQ
jgi:lambda family phage portal protein